MKAEAGTYALILPAITSDCRQIGKLGLLNIQSGFYVYIGSALGRGGIQARIQHHQQVSKNPHWHIDYLRQVLPLSTIWITYNQTRREHQWANGYQKMQNVTIPLKGFGSSDCHCSTHLFFTESLPSYTDFVNQMKSIEPHHPPILIETLRK